MAAHCHFLQVYPVVFHWLMIPTLWSHSALPDDGHPHSVSRSDSQTTAMDNSGTSTEHRARPRLHPHPPHAQCIPRIRSALSSPSPIPTTTAPSPPQPSIAAQALRRPPRTSKYPSTATARTSLPRRRRLCQGVVRVIYPDLPSVPSVLQNLGGAAVTRGHWNPDAPSWDGRPCSSGLCLGFFGWPPALSPPADRTM